MTSFGAMENEANVVLSAGNVTLHTAGECDASIFDRAMSTLAVLREKAAENHQQYEVRGRKATITLVPSSVNSIAHS